MINGDVVQVILSFSSQDGEHIRRKIGQDSTRISCGVACLPSGGLQGRGGERLMDDSEAVLQCATSQGEVTSLGILEDGENGWKLIRKEMHAVCELLQYEDIQHVLKSILL